MATVDRSGPLRIDWRYARGEQQPAGDMIVMIRQGGVRVSCAAPAANRSISIPGAVLERFSPEPAFVDLASAASGTFDTILEEDLVKLAVSIASRVDIGVGEQDEEPNLVFR